MPCSLCPRACMAERGTDAAPLGRCETPEGIVAARAALHFWEEPCVSGSRGSGTVFFSGCPLRCVFCQNAEISRGGKGKPLSPEELAGVFLSLRDKGAHNINLVNPTHQLPHIAKALSLCLDKLNLPVVANSGGYERPETVERYAGLIDVFLPDLKFFSPSLSERYAGAPDYFRFASESILTMYKLKGKPVFRDGMIERGLIVRHLALPSHVEDSLAIIRWLREHLPPDGFVFSLMAQYTPTEACAPYREINRRITTYEYNKLVDAALEAGFVYAYSQERSSASAAYVPAFDFEGL